MLFDVELVHHFASVEILLHRLLLAFLVFVDNLVQNIASASLPIALLTDDRIFSQGKLTMLKPWPLGEHRRDITVVAIQQIKCVDGCAHGGYGGLWTLLRAKVPSGGGE